MNATSREKAKDDSDALEQTALRINPEVLRGVPPLPDLDDIEVVLIQPSSCWTRWREGLMIHVVGSGIVAVLAFIAGLMFAGTTNTAEGAPKLPPPSCITTTVPEPIPDQNKPE